MMDDRYTIVIDPARQLVVLRLIGQWDGATVAAYSRDLDLAMGRMAEEGGRPGEYLLLVDLRRQNVQSKEVATASQAIAAAYFSMTRRVAVITSPSALHRIQARRISGHLNPGCFWDETEARAYLFA